MKNIILNKIGQVIIGAVDWFLIGSCLVVAEKVVNFVEDKIKEKKNKKL